MSRTFGYVRISSSDQNEDRQLLALRKLNIPTQLIYIDKQSGKDFNRPQFCNLLEVLSPGDVLYVTGIDRLGCNYHEIREQWRKLTQELGVDICILDMPLLDTR